MTHEKLQNKVGYSLEPTATPEEWAERFAESKAVFDEGMRSIDKRIEDFLKFRERNLKEITDPVRREIAERFDPSW